jgi:hypothetical protein
MMGASGSVQPAGINHNSNPLAPMKPVLAAALMFCAAWLLFRDLRAAAIAAAVPLALGWLNIGRSFAYLLTALAITAAVLSVILPERTRIAVEQRILGGSGTHSAIVAGDRR